MALAVGNEYVAHSHRDNSALENRCRPSERLTWARSSPDGPFVDFPLLESDVESSHLQQPMLPPGSGITMSHMVESRVQLAAISWLIVEDDPNDRQRRPSLHDMSQMRSVDVHLTCS